MLTSHCIEYFKNLILARYVQPYYTNEGHLVSHLSQHLAKQATSYAKTTCLIIYWKKHCHSYSKNRFWNRHAYVKNNILLERRSRRSLDCKLTVRCPTEGTVRLILQRSFVSYIYLTQIWKWQVVLDQNIKYFKNFLF